ncbi:hypothetical protein HWV62_27361 [Athelia sp. TMB]|nr:hypothetical protein HWV62_27361 [Athelia sp. TMB]
MPFVYTPTSSPTRLPKANAQEFITPSQMRKFIVEGPIDDNDIYFEYLLKGWYDFVLPFTPSSIDAAGSNFDVPDVVPALLVHLAKSVCQLPLMGTLITKVVTIWPNIWTWLRLLYRSNIKARDSGAPFTKILRERQMAVFHFLSFCAHEKPSHPLSDAIVDTPGTLEMMAAMWIGEGYDERRLFGFRSGKWGTPSYTIEARFAEMLVAACGSSDAVVDLVCRRIELNLGQPKPDHDCLVEDVE